MGSMSPGLDYWEAISDGKGEALVKQAQYNASRGGGGSPFPGTK